MPTAPATLTAAPTSPDRSDRATFSARAVALDDWTKNTHVPELQAALDNVYANALEVASTATTSGDLVALAAAAANYVGLWSAQVGALSKPASVSHNGNYWALNTDLADVTAATPGVSASWSALNVGAGGATESSSAVDILLTAVSYRVQTVAMTATYKSVFMPEATTLPTGGALFIVKNIGDLQFVVRGFSGDVLAVLDPGMTVIMHLANAGSSAGAWVAFGSEGAMGSVADAVATAVNATTSGHVQIVTLSTTAALVAWRDVSGGWLKACVLTITGTSISPGTIHTTAIAVAQQRIRMCVMSSTQVIAFYTASGTTYPWAVTLNVTGTNVAAGTAFQVTSVACGDGADITAMSSVQAMIVYKGTSGYCEVRTLNVTGLDIASAGAITVVAASVDTPAAIAAISTTQAVVAINNSGVITYAYLATVSGTAVSLGASPTQMLLTSAKAVMCAINATQVVVFGSAYTSSAPRLILLTVSGSTVVVSDHLDSTGFETSYAADMALISATRVALLRSPVGGSTGSNKHALQILRVNDSVMRTNHERSPVKNSKGDGASNASVAVLTPKKLIVAYVDPSTFLQARILEIAK